LVLKKRDSFKKKIGKGLYVDENIKMPLAQFLKQKSSRAS
jgi:hypothetical protein